MPIVTASQAAEPVSQPGDAANTDGANADDADQAPVSLAELVADQPQPDELSQQMNCLAGAVYFEAKGETLAGQLAVGRVIVARAESGRFPDSYCGVVYQRAQFSFVRGHAMPTINRDSQSWRNAVAIAQIADGGSWKSKAEGALFFHAAHVSPHWGRVRVAQIDNHIFYR
jgi:spore germination cell wall hydrolase CwlJ-like protein